MESITLLPLEKLFPSRCNVRLHVREDRVRELAENIAIYGLLHPLVVRPEGDYYGVVSGRVRLEAIKLLQRERPEVFEKLFGSGVPCMVKELDNREAIELSLSENLRQNTLTPEEVGRGLARLSEMGIREEEMLQRLQVGLEELRRLLRLYARLREIAPVIAESRPGRPSSKPRRKVSRTGMVKVTRAVEELAQVGAISDPDSVVKRVAELAAERGLSTSELEIIARRIRERPELAERPEALVEELAGEEMVERVVLLKQMVVEYVEECARSKGVTFSEALNELLEEHMRAAA